MRDLAAKVGDPEALADRGGADGLDPDERADPDAVAEVVAEHPIVLQRPVVVHGDDAGVARDEDTLDDVLDRVACPRSHGWDPAAVLVAGARTRAGHDAPHPPLPRLRRDLARGPARPADRARGRRRGHAHPFLDLRETDAWGLDEPDGRRLRATLEGLDHEPAQRYAYLVEEDTRLLLVRLRPDWVAQHAWPAPA